MLKIKRDFILLGFIILLNSISFQSLLYALESNYIESIYYGTKYGNTLSSGKAYTIFYYEEWGALLLSFVFSFVILRKRIHHSVILFLIALIWYLFGLNNKILSFVGVLFVSNFMNFKMIYFMFFFVLLMGSMLLIYFQNKNSSKN